MKKIATKLFAMILTVLMLVSIIPMAAFAAGESGFGSDAAKVVYEDGTLSFLFSADKAAEIIEKNRTLTKADLAAMLPDELLSVYRTQGASALFDFSLYTDVIGLEDVLDLIPATYLEGAGIRTTLPADIVDQFPAHVAAAYNAGGITALLDESIYTDAAEMAAVASLVPAEYFDLPTNGELNRIAASVLSLAETVKINDTTVYGADGVYKFSPKAIVSALSAAVPETIESSDIGAIGVITYNVAIESMIDPADNFDFNVEIGFYGDVAKAQQAIDVYADRVTAEYTHAYDDAAGEQTETVLALTQLLTVYIPRFLESDRFSDETKIEALELMNGTVNGFVEKIKSLDAETVQAKLEALNYSLTDIAAEALDNDKVLAAFETVKSGADEIPADVLAQNIADIYLGSGEFKITLEFEKLFYDILDRISASAPDFSSKIDSIKNQFLNETLNSVYEGTLSLEDVRQVKFYDYKGETLYFTVYLPTGTDFALATDLISVLTGKTWVKAIGSTEVVTEVPAEDSCVYEPKTYKVIFKADGTEVAAVEYPYGADSITEPDVPAKEGYTGAWEAYTLNSAEEITVNAVYTAKTYKVIFVADGTVVATVEYPYGTDSIEAPAVPDKEGYTGEWEEYTLNSAEEITVNAIYTQIDVPPTGDTVASVSVLAVVTAAASLLLKKKRLF